MGDFVGVDSCHPMVVTFQDHETRCRERRWRYSPTESGLIGSCVAQISNVGTRRCRSVSVVPGWSSHIHDGLVGFAVRDDGRQSVAPSDDISMPPDVAASTRCETRSGRRHAAPQESARRRATTTHPALRLRAETRSEAARSFP